MQNGGRSNQFSWSVGTDTVLLSDPVCLGSSTALFEPNGVTMGQLDSFKASAVPAGSSGDIAEPSGRSQSAEVVKHGRLAGRARAPHRQATWILTSVSFGALLVAAIAWSLVVSGRWVAVGSVEVAVVFVVLMARGHYRVRMVTELFAELPAIGAAVGLAGTAGIGVAVLPWFGQPELSMFLLLSLFLFVAVVGARVIGVGVLRVLWGRGLLRSKAIVYGVDQLSRELAIELSVRRQQGVDVVGFVGEESSPEENSIVAVHGRDEDLAGIFTETGADRLIVVQSSGEDSRFAIAAARWGITNCVPVHVLPALRELGLGLNSMAGDRARGYALVRLQPAAHPRLARRAKRLLDIVVAGLVLCLMAPVLAVSALLVRLTSPGPVLFSQERIGSGGQPILIYKFRSMAMSEESDTEWVADARVTRVGGWLRRTSIDELPQLYSILIGEMSLVGPRPERPAFVKQFSAEIDDYTERHRMPVGLTGLAQVAGFRGDTSIAERVKYDNLYIDQWSLMLDLQILAKTVKAILLQDRYTAQARELETALAEGLESSR